MLRCYRPQGSALAIVPVSQDAIRPALGEGTIWIDLLRPEPEESRAVEEALGVVLPSFDEMREIEVSSRLYVEDQARFMTVTAVAGLSRDKAEKTPVTFVLTNGILVTIRHIETRTFDVFTQACEKGGPQTPTTGETVMLGIVEAIVDRTADALERISDLVDEVSVGVFRAPHLREDGTRDLRSVIEDIGHQGDMLSSIQESLVSMRRLAAFYEGPGGPGQKPGRDIKQRLELVERDSASLVDHVGFLNDKISFLLNATLGLISLEQNQTIKMFSVVAVIFMPPTLIASIYGMNFVGIPELHWAFGYPMALGLMLASAITPYLFFRHKKWL